MEMWLCPVSWFVDFALKYLAAVKGDLKAEFGISHLTFSSLRRGKFLKIDISAKTSDAFLPTHSHSRIGNSYLTGACKSLPARITRKRLPILINWSFFRSRRPCAWMLLEVRMKRSDEKNISRMWNPEMLFLFVCETTTLSKVLLLALINGSPSNSNGSKHPAEFSAQIRACAFSYICQTRFVDGRNPLKRGLGCHEGEPTPSRLLKEGVSAKGFPRNISSAVSFLVYPKHM